MNDNFKYAEVIIAGWRLSTGLPLPFIFRTDGTTRNNHHRATRPPPI